MDQKAAFVGRVLTALLSIGTVGPEVEKPTVADVAGTFWEPSAHNSNSWEYDVDTRLLLLVKYPSGNIPPRAEISEIGHAVTHQLRQLNNELWTGSSVRDMFFLWLMWFLITVADPGQDVANDPGTVQLDSDGDKVHRHSLFAVVFELVSAFGNVGLSLGSYKDVDSPCSFSVDLDVMCKGIVMLTMVVGRTRDFPKAVDSALDVPYSTLADLLRDIDEQDQQCLLSRATLSGTANPASKRKWGRQVRASEPSTEVQTNEDRVMWRASTHDNLMTSTIDLTRNT
eukprot:SAG11_NODE_100_length_16863_cov_12.374911_3_plen_284_part_00